MVLRQKLYKTLKDQGQHVEWKKTTIPQLQESIAIYRGQQKRMARIYNLVSHAQTRRIDTRNLRSIRRLPNREQVNLPINQFNRIINRLSAPEDRYLFIHIKDEHGSIRKSVSLNHRHFEHDNLFISVQEGIDSDSDFTVQDLRLGSVALEWLPKARHQTKRSEFFCYFTNQDFKLEEFQVYISGYQFGNSSKDADIPCFLYALQQAGVEESIVASISSVMYSSSATHDFIRKIAETFDLHITMKTYKEDASRFGFNRTSYGIKTDNPIELGCVGQHLFAIKPTKVSQHALLHPSFVGHPDFPSIRVKNNRIVKNGNPTLLDSLQVIGHLYFHRNKMLTPITLQNAPTLLNNKYSQVTSLNSLALNDRWFKSIGLSTVDGVTTGYKYGAYPFTRVEDKEVIRESFETVYFDLETFSDLKSNIITRFPEFAIDHVDGDHIPYLAAWRVGNKPTQYAFGLNCVKTMLDSLPPDGNYLMLAHNAGFDVRFLIKHLTAFDTRAGVIESGNSMKQLIGMYEGRKLVIKDTKSFINEALSVIPEMFPGACDELTLEKESFPHDLMNADSFDSFMCLDLIRSEFSDAENLIVNASKIGAIQGNTLDVTKYAIHYCKRDVDVLASCFERFRSMFKDRFKQDVYHHISMPGLSYAILHNEGCYDNCVSMAGPCLEFSRSAIVGGRIMTRDNVPHHTKHEIVDFDAVSLYPSSMTRLGETKSDQTPRGFAQGKPKIHRETIPKCDYHISKVKITSIAKTLHFPLQSVKEKDESRDFRNDIVGRKMILDQYDLEDLVEFQGATYEVIEGLYWNEGFNKNIINSISKLFNERLRLKKKENPLQGGIKNLMNSGYGKLIQKPIVKQKTLIKGVQAIDEYTVKRINRLIQRVPITTDIALFEEHKPLNKHFTPAHLGVQILSMSKRIMNEVMCLAEECDLKIWYQDTDSMHIDRDALPSLVEAYDSKYNRKLIGEGLGQFHPDFAIKDDDGKKIKNTGEIFATESYFIGKKTYVDFLACTDLDIRQVHKRMKGIPSKLITDPRATYDGLFKGEDQSFNMSKACPLVINNKTQRVSKQRPDFGRVVRAPPNCIPI